MKNKKKILSLIVASILLMVMFTGCGDKQEKEVVHIGHKNYTEARILGQMFAVVIEEKTDMETKVTEFGGTVVAFEALKSGEIDLYPEYTGTAYGAIFGLSELKDPQAVYDYVEKEFKDQYNIIWGEQLGYNNTYTFAIRPEIAEKYDLETFDDLATVAPELSLVATTEFIERQDGLPGVKELYGGFEFNNVISMDAGLRYIAIDQKEGDVMDAFSTDGKLIEYDLRVLEDTKNFFPPYYVAPILHGDYNAENPEVYEALKLLGGQVSESEMQQMNYEVSNNGANERDIAENFLRSKGLID